MNGCMHCLIAYWNTFLTLTLWVWTSGLGETKTLITWLVMSKIAFKFKESILILIRSINIYNYVLLLCWNSEFVCQTPLVLLLCSSRNWSFGRKYWLLGDDLVHFHILHFISFNLVGYVLYQIWRRCRGPIVLFKVKFSVCLCLWVGVLVCVCV